jgi:hypothetical protein
VNVCVCVCVWFCLLNSPVNTFSMYVVCVFPLSCIAFSVACCYGLYVRVRNNVSVVIPIHISSAPFPPPRKLIDRPLGDLVVSGSLDGSPQGLYGVLANTTPVLPDTDEYYHHSRKPSPQMGSIMSDEGQAGRATASSSSDASGEDGSTSSLDTSSAAWAHPASTAPSAVLGGVDGALRTASPLVREHKSSSAATSKRSFKLWKRNGSDNRRKSKSGSKDAKLKKAAKSSKSIKTITVAPSTHATRWEQEQDTTTRLINGL